MSTTIVILILVGLVVLAFLASNIVSKSFRMPEHGWRAAIVVFSVGVAILIVSTTPFKQGIDLVGGVILRYEVDELKTEQAKTDEADSDSGQPDFKMSALVEAIGKRINPGGVQEIVVRPYGEKQVEIVIPNVGSQEVKLIKQKIITGGFLKFLIVANQRNHNHVWSLADEPAQLGNTIIRDANKKTVGQWVDVDYTDLEDGTRSYNVDTATAKTREVGGVRQVLMYVDQNFPLEGNHLASVREGYQDLSPCVFFNMTPKGARLMGGITASNKPDTAANLYSRLGIVLDGVLISAPRINTTITDSGIIEGRFTRDEVRVLVDVLRAGQLPAVLRDTPISESDVSALLGADTIRRGKTAIGISLVAVLIFMLIYYRFAGIVSSFALLLNLLLIFAMMIFVGAAFSLAGFAGLVLTVGMSVDANVLIFERIREELRHGAGLRMAIRNGFSRATPTIVDANVTNLITALVLYGMGGEQLQGYAVPLILGILMCLFTSIFVSRMVFEIAERQRWIKKLSMMQFLAAPKWNLFGSRGIAAVVSIAVISLGLICAGSRGQKLFDIDFLGGNSVTLKLAESTPIEDVRELVGDVADDVLVTAIQSENEKDQVYQVDTSRISTATDNDALNVDDVKASLTEKLGKLLVTHSISFTEPSAYVAAAPATSDTTVETPPAPSDSGPSISEPNIVVPEDGTNPDTDSDQTEPESTDSSFINRNNDQSIALTKRLGMLLSQTDVASESASSQFSSTITFDENINAETLREAINAAASALDMAVPNFELKNDEWDGKSSNSFLEWQLVMSASKEDTSKILGQLKTTLEQSPVWLSANTVGSKVAGDTKESAIAAIVMSLLGIVAYIWIRFQRVVFGLAAVVALIHDVLVTIGAIGFSFYIVQYMSGVAAPLMINEFKISLPVVAAILTIIGYSLNDTIVVFDRIREVKGKSPEITAEIINSSINQTLSRTILTSLTTLIAVTILYFMGGPGIHPFSFALMIGVVVGTYSSIFVASPALLWMSKPKVAKAKETPEKVTA